MVYITLSHILQASLCCAGYCIFCRVSNLYTKDQGWAQKNTLIEQYKNGCGLVVSMGKLMKRKSWISMALGFQVSYHKDVIMCNNPRLLEWFSYASMRVCFFL